MDLELSRVRLLMILTLALPMAACVTVIRDLSVGPVSVVEPPADTDWPVDRPVISVSLRTHKALSRVSEAYPIDTKIVFCESPEEFALLGSPFVYVGWPPVRLTKAASIPDNSGTY